MSPFWPFPAPWEGGGGSTDSLIHAAALCLALAVDRCFGEPPARWHPVVWMGRYLCATGRRIAPPTGGRASLSARAFATGMLAWCLGATVVVLLAALVGLVCASLPAWAEAAALALALKPLLAWRMLRGEVLAVESALASSLDEGRARLSRLVSRDVRPLDEGQVRESAIESLAENLNDSVIAPLFWFLLLGLPGAALYRFANTADAMWGYRGTRDGRVWEWAGKWAARADDLLSWLPARLTALLLWAPGLAGVRREAARTPSPNSGWPMAAMALRLGVRLAKPAVYVLNAGGRVPTPADTRQAADIGSRAVGRMALLASAVLLVPAAWGHA
ncbi:adenosylcobinamide-phosphate synthase CbiB [Variovorax defluvii]|uniref:Cobalamin biosynthesis protein CobD n=1 Tax=Variovorax defluvii TaxID=913761 RepID=A0ABP8I7Z9_9BURK